VSLFWSHCPCSCLLELRRWLSILATKGQLQTAADAAALAGGHELGHGSDDVIRFLAYTTAKQNKAAGQPVRIDPDADVSFGFWNYSTRSFASPTPYGRPVNAIKVQALRTEGSRSGAVKAFFARALGWENLETAADAVAALRAPVWLYVAASRDICGTGTTCTYPNECRPNKTLVTKSNSGGPLYDDEFAWTSLSEKASSTDKIRPLLNDDVSYLDVCNENIYTTNGTVDALFEHLEMVKNDPTKDAENKTSDGWWVSIPLTRSGVSPGQQGSGNDPKVVQGYAKVRIRSISSNGNEKEIVIDRITCSDCTGSNSLRIVRLVE